jgi:uracil-DNA glycosylase family 4
MSKDKKKKLLGELKEKMLNDKLLPLREGNTNLVFGDGDPDAEIMFIGEGPGFWEDKKGIPFVGNAGALLNQFLVSVSILREEVFITNVVHYRPPENRDPTPDELSAFRPYLDKMIDIIDPKIIVTLGRFSMAKFIPGVFISSVHGKPRKINWKGRDIIVLPMYHPAAALRSGDVKMKAKRDFELLPELLKDSNNVEKEEKEVEEKKSEQMSLI